MPVSESNTSLLKLIQAKIKIDASRKIEKTPRRIVLVSAKATAVPTQIGMTATLYMGGLMAANHSFWVEVDGTTDLVVILQD
jgi:hypothetical protein